MKKSVTFNLVLTALFAALACACTLVISIPMPTGGYVNIGDAIIYIAAIVVGPFLGGAAGAIGACIADIILGYAFYAPATFIIKGIEGIVCGIMYFAVLKNAKPFVRRLVSMLVAGMAMSIGYFLFDWAIVGFAAALYNLIPVQMLIATAVALVALPKVPSFFEFGGGKKGDETKSHTEAGANTDTESRVDEVDVSLDEYNCADKDEQRDCTERKEEK